MAICKLCLQDRELIKKSHIIPEFMYQDLFDDKHKMFSFHPHERVKGEGYINRPSSGEYEGNLFCLECDSKIIGEYENYASKAIYGGQLPADECPICTNYKNKQDIHFTTCKNISYQKFKIFLLSILWRSSISSRPFFNDISLGPHAETIRRMIYEGNAGESDDYPIFFMTFFNDKTMPIDLVAHPQMRKTKDGNRYYVFMIGGMVYVYYVNVRTHKLPNYILTETLKPTNEMNIIHIPPGKGWNLILGYYGLK